MSNYLITIKYDGTKYNGWQKQGNTSNTIQSKIECILNKMTGEFVEIHGSGRTDKGVHALGQAASFHLSNFYECSFIINYLNEYLPKDISATNISMVDERFHGRLNVKNKTYIYRIDNGFFQDPFNRYYSYWLPQELNIEQMNLAAKLLIGTHDYIGFSSLKKTKKSTIRTLTSISIDKTTPIITISYTGDGFLYNMVRILSGTLIEVGLGKRDSKEIINILETKNRIEAGFTAPPQGLFLEKVVY